MYSKLSFHCNIPLSVLMVLLMSIKPHTSHEASHPLELGSIGKAENNSDTHSTNETNIALFDKPTQTLPKSLDVLSEKLVNFKFQLEVLMKEIETRGEKISREEQEIEKQTVEIKKLEELLKQKEENISIAETKATQREEKLKLWEEKLQLKLKEKNICPLSWVWASNGSVPSNAIVGGNTSTGEQLYIGRIWHDGDLIPGKIHPSHECLYITYGSKEYKYSEYEVAVVEESNPCSIAWVRSSYELPFNAVIGGHTGMDDKLYVGRISLNGELIPGKIHLRYRCLYIAYNHTEECHNEFEVATFELP